MSTSEDMTPLLGYRLKLAQHSLHRRIEEVLRPLGVSPAQFAVLAALNQHPDQTNADLAERAFITAQAMQGVLAGLEAADMVERRQDPYHGRRQLARLTGKGRALADVAADRVRRVEAELEASVAPMNLRDALALVNRMHMAMARSVSGQG